MVGKHFTGHNAWSKECSKKKMDIERMKIAKANTPHYHGTTQLFAPGRYERGRSGSRSQTNGKRQPDVDAEGFMTPSYNRTSSNRAGPSVLGRGRGGSSIASRGGLTNSRVPLIPLQIPPRGGSPALRTRSKSPAKTPTVPGATTRS